MDPIINPWLFYLFELVTKLGGVVGILISISIIAIIILVVTFPSTDDEDYTAEEKEKTRKWLKTLVIAVSILTLLRVIIPSKDTLILMCTASKITPNNISSLKNEAKYNKEDLKIDIIEILLKTQKELEKK